MFSDLFYIYDGSYLVLFLWLDLKFLFLDLPLIVYDHKLHPVVPGRIELTKLSFVCFDYIGHVYSVLNILMDGIIVLCLFSVNYLVLNCNT